MSGVKLGQPVKIGDPKYFGFGYTNQNNDGSRIRTNWLSHLETNIDRDDLSFEIYDRNGLPIKFATSEGVPLDTSTDFYGSAGAKVWKAKDGKLDLQFNVDPAYIKRVTIHVARASDVTFTNFPLAPH